MAEAGCGVPAVRPLQGQLHGQVAPQDDADDRQRGAAQQPEGPQPEPVCPGAAPGPLLCGHTSACHQICRGKQAFPLLPAGSAPECRYCFAVKVPACLGLDVIGLVLNKQCCACAGVGSVQGFWAGSAACAPSAGPVKPPHGPAAQGEPHLHSLSAWCKDCSASNAPCQGHLHECNNHRKEQLRSSTSLPRFCKTVSPQFPPTRPVQY